MNPIRPLRCSPLWFVAIAVLLTAAPLSAQTTNVFTYQGQLRANGTNAGGTNVLTFRLYDAPDGTNQIGVSVTNSVPVSNGLFTTSLDFGPGAFNGSPRWLEVTVQVGTTNHILTPRQTITPAPYALFALSAASLSSNANFSAENLSTGNLTVGDDVNSFQLRLDSDGNLVLGVLVAPTNSAKVLPVDKIFVPLITFGRDFLARVWNDLTVNNKLNILGNLKATAMELVGNFFVGGWTIKIGTRNGVEDVIILSNGGVERTYFLPTGTMNTTSNLVVDQTLYVLGGGIQLYGTNGQIRFPDGSVQTNAAPPIVPRGMAIFDTPGTTNFAVPAGVTHIVVELWGGGGGGGNWDEASFGPGAGGGGGGYGRHFLNVTPGSIHQITVGQGGSIAGNGGTSSFGGLVTATGGMAGDSGDLGGFGGKGGSSDAMISVNGEDGFGGHEGRAYTGGSGGEAFSGGRRSRTIFTFPRANTENGSGGIPGGGGAGGSRPATPTTGFAGGRGRVAISY